MIEKTLPFYLSFILLALVSSCGSSDVAGATGVGNPNGQSTLISASAVPGITAGQYDTFVNDLGVIQNTARQKKTASPDLTDSNGASFTVAAMAITIDSIVWTTASESVRTDGVSGNVHRTGNDLIAVGPWQMDLLTGKSVSGLNVAVAIPEGSYTSVKFYVSGTKTNPSVIVRGTVLKDEKETPYRIALPIEMTLKFDSKQPVLFGGERGKDLELLYNSDLWLKDIEAFSVGDMIQDTLVIASETIQASENGTTHLFRNGIRKSGVLRLKE